MKLKLKNQEYLVDLLKQRVRHTEDELHGYERALDAITERKRFVNQANKDEIFDTLRYFVLDYYTYPKEKMYSGYSEIWDVDFGKLTEVLKMNGVDI